MNVEQIHKEALAAAQTATQKFLAANSDFDSCGFAWVACYEKGTSKLIRELKKHGFSRAYNSGYQLWNPSGSPSQSVTAKEVGADAYVATWRKHMPDIKMYAASRLD